MSSYIYRLAAANGTDVQVVRRWLIQTGALGPFPDQDSWDIAWRALGNVHPARSEHEPSTVDVADRLLCLRCTHGQRASGRLARSGLVCAKHGCWIDPVDGSRADPQSLHTERRFRHVLVPAGMTIESPELRFAQRLVLLTIDRQWIEQEQQRIAVHSTRAAIYAPQVEIAAALFVGDELAALARERPGQRLAPSTDWVASHIGRLSSRSEPWRAGALLSHPLVELERAQSLSELAGGVRADILHRLAR